MIAIVGESASGKSTLADMMVRENAKYKKVITYTTREPREGEIDGVHYHFISDQEFSKKIESHFFIEHATYNGWLYGTAKEDCYEQNAILVVTPSGLRNLIRCGIDVISIYLCVDRRSRLIKILQRGDNIEEAYRRSLSDVGQFDGINYEVDIIINNIQYKKSKDEILQEAMYKIERLVKDFECSNS